MRFLGLLLLVVVGARFADAQKSRSWQAVVPMIEQHCLDCHDADTRKGDLDLERLIDATDDLLNHTDAAQWEQVVRQLQSRQMPPLNKKKRPSNAAYERATAGIITVLDARAAAHPQPGRTDTLRRLNRTEYQNAVRDLLAVEIDAAELLPADESSHGFDNVTVANLSPALLERYLSAARKISRLAVGASVREPDSRIVRIRPDITQESRVPGLPFGTQGGAVIRHTFPRAGEYEFRVLLARDRNEEIEGLRGTFQLDLLFDRERKATFEVKPPRNRNDHTKVDAHLVKRLQVGVGPCDIGVTFRKQPNSLEENLRQPYDAHFNVHRHPRLTPAIFQVTITGPFEEEGKVEGEGEGKGEADAKTAGALALESPSHQQIFAGRAEDAGADLVEAGEAAARKVLGRLMRRAYRRPVTNADFERVMPFYADARTDGGSFEAGIESALAAVLVSRDFLFRIERDPDDLEPGAAYAVSDLELASRLSFFLWRSLPDESLLQHAVAGILHQPDVLEAETRRMLADPRAARALVGSFADQWLYLRNLESITPDGRLYPGFDDNLRQAFRRETELLFDRVVREDGPVLELLRSDVTHLNERLAKHYGIPHIYGSHFRPVQLEPAWQRGGILRHGSVLTVTSYATRTSPVIRGHWILENLLGTPPPPPPADVPGLEEQENSVDADLPMRERLAEHRENPACASCHDVMDPVGFALENYDAVGRWRLRERGSEQDIDASGGLPGRAGFVGVAGLEQGLIDQPDLFARTLTEKLLTYALGRGVESGDGPAIRGVVRTASERDYRFSDLVVGLVKSAPFTMRSASGPAPGSPGEVPSKNDDLRLETKQK